MTSDSGATSTRHPSWLKKRVQSASEPGYEYVSSLLHELGLETVCKNAQCPNQRECFGKRTATFMILGSICTRNCAFCAVATGTPASPRLDEPARVAKAVAALGLRHVVVTSVTRDDLPDKGAAQFAAVVRALHDEVGCVVEVLTPDFCGDRNLIEMVVNGHPDIFNHNVETVRRLYPHVRPGADFGTSVSVLATVRELDRRIFTKSGLMLGLGETRREILETLQALRQADVDIVTLGQYLAPSKRHYPVARYIPPEEFDELEIAAMKLGFKAASAGPFVRSSYNAAHVFGQIRRAIDEGRDKGS